MVAQLQPERILEVGSYEDKSTTWLIERIASHRSVVIHCVDSSEGGIEHKARGSARADMTAVENRLHHNIKTAQSKVAYTANITTHKGISNSELPRLVAEGMSGYFDFIYIDGSYQSPDVLCNSALGFELLKTKGIIAFDDSL